MSPARWKVLVGVAAVLVVALLWNWISGWGLVTVHASEQPLSKIVRSIERQGGIKIVTNAAPDTPVSMDVDRVPPVEAVDVLAARIDGNWSVGYVAGPSKTDVTAGIAQISEGGRGGDFRSFGFGGFGGGMMDFSTTPVDARLVAWSVSPSDTPQLQSYLDQLSQKTGLMAMVPQGWNPDVPAVPKGGRAGNALRDLVKSVKGAYQELFVVRISNWDRDSAAGNDQSDQQRPARTDGGFAQRRDQNADRGDQPRDGGGRRDFHPEWMEERAMARIAQLPAAEREQAKKDFEDMREMMSKIRALPEQERRAAMEQFFNNPVVQQRMSDRMAERDERSGPERRAERSRRYIQRKQQMKDQDTSS